MLGGTAEGTVVVAVLPGIDAGGPVPNGSLGGAELVTGGTGTLGLCIDIGTGCAAGTELVTAPVAGLF